MADFLCQCEMVMQTRYLSSLPEKIWQSMQRLILPWRWKNFKNRGYAQLGGIILNRRDVLREEEKVAELADDFHTEVIGTLSHSEQVALAEAQGMTLMECYPNSAMAEEYRVIAKRNVHPCAVVLWRKIRCCSE